MLLPEDDEEQGSTTNQKEKRDEAKPPPDPTAERHRKRRNWVIAAIVGAVLLIGLIVFGAYWWTTLRWFASTDDAYTQSEAVVIAPKVAGYAAKLLVTDNQQVKAGDILVPEMTTHDYQAALSQALANQEKDQANLANAQRNFARDAALLPANLAVSRQQYDNDQATVAADQSQVDSDKAQVDQARLNLSYTNIRSPVDGAVGDRSVELGAYLQPGQGLMSIVPMGRAIYVVANFKETDIEQMFRGETVDLSIDTFPGVKFVGKVDSLAPGSGAQFALLPPENATGNFTKIVQRVPVKILITEAPQDRLDQLRPGLSVEADVDSRTAPPPDQRRTLVAPQSSAEPVMARGGEKGNTSFRVHWVAVFGAILGAFMAVLDIQITNASLPDIQGGISASLDEGTWISTAYLVAEIITIPLTDGFQGLFDAPLSHWQLHPVPWFFDALRAVDEPDDDDHLPGGAGFYRRRFHSQRDDDRFALPAIVEAVDRTGALRHHRDLCAGDRPDGGRLADRHLFLALDFLHQPRSGNDPDLGDRLWSRQGAGENTTCCGTGIGSGIVYAQRSIPASCLRCVAKKASARNGSKTPSVDPVTPPRPAARSSFPPLSAIEILCANARSSICGCSARRVSPAPRRLGLPWWVSGFKRHGLRDAGLSRANPGV